MTPADPQQHQQQWSLAMARRTRAPVRRDRASKTARNRASKTGRTSARKIKRRVGADTRARQASFYTPEFLAEARRRMEQTLQRTTAIAADLGMHHSVLSRLAQREGWVRPQAALRRRGVTPLMRLAGAADALVRVALPPRGGGEGREPTTQAAPPTPDPSPPLAPLAGGGETAPPAPATPAPAVAADTSAIDRLEQAVLNELATVETMRASLGAEPLRPMDAERTVSVLTETLSKLRRLRLAAQPQPGSDHDDMPADIDEFRRDLARRIDLFVASREDGESAGGD
jgi:hypothetical protein